MIIKDNEYSIHYAVWELTFACNMRCKHCGSGCGDPKPDELTTKEALDLCDQLIDSGLKHITLSGGEPFLRNDWPIIAKKIADGNATVNAISNGWLIDENIVNKALDAGMSDIAVSLDGSEKAHDHIRTKGSFDKVIKALELMQRMRMPAGVCTALNRHNIKDLPYIKQLLIEKEVDSWQLQLTEPMGNALDHEEMILAPGDLEQILDFAHEVSLEDKIIVDLADNLGYFDCKSTEVHQNYPDGLRGNGIWSGCKAGKSVIGIRCNGDITGCLSIRDDDFIEGNIRNTSLREIWTRPGAFAWNRDMTRENLTGFCKECQFGDLCLGGCTTMKRTMSKTLYENKYCFYRTEFMRECEIIDGLSDLEDLLSKGHELTEACQYEAAEKCLSKTLELYPDCTEAMDQLGFVKYELEKYDECVQLNRKSIALDPNNPYAHKGLGVVLAKVGKLEEGIASLRRAIELCDENFMEPYYDFAVILLNNNRHKEALAILEEGRSKSNEFKMRSEGLYQGLLNS